MKKTGASSKLILFFLITILYTLTFFPIQIHVYAQEISVNKSEYFMGIEILESIQPKILESINKVKELQLGNMVILHPLDQEWDPDLIEEAIEEANNLELYVIFETFNFSDHKIRITPEHFRTWQIKYPYLLGILVQEVTGKQTDMNLWLNELNEEIDTRLEAEKAIIENLTTSMKLPEYKQKGAKIFLQENVISYVSANTSHCDVLVAKVFNAPNTELMIGTTRGMANSYNISEWGLWVDTWREWQEPPADFIANDIKKALYEGWFYGAKYFFFEQGTFFGTLNRTWNETGKHIILDKNGELTEYGKVIQEFYIFLQNQQKLNYIQPDYKSPIAVMIGQSGWTGRGKNWGLWDQESEQADFDYRLLNIFYPGIGDNWEIGHAATGKEFTGLPFGIVDIISIYAPPSVLKQYKVIIALGWSQISNQIADNIDGYVKDGGIFFCLFTFTHNNKDVDILNDTYAWTDGFSGIFGGEVTTSPNGTQNIISDDYLYNIKFTKDTFWYPWNGKTYKYSDPGKTDQWYKRFNYEISNYTNATVIAWTNGNETPPNAFIIENRKGNGYTYVVNARSILIENGSLIKIISDFIQFLCTTYKKPMIYYPYPQTEYWLNQGQANKTIYLIHDNSTITRNFTYNVNPFQANLSQNKNYLIFDYFNKEDYGFNTKTIEPLNLTLKPKEAKLLKYIETQNTPEIVYSNAIILESSDYSKQKLFVNQRGVQKAQNLTIIFCSELETPQYILGASFNLTQSYNAQNKVLSINSPRNFTVGWEPKTDVYISESTVALTNVTWNESIGSLDIKIDQIFGQEASIKVKSRESTAYYVKINGKETAEWDYNPLKDEIQINYESTSNPTEIIVGFKPIWIDQSIVTDERTDVGSLQSVKFHTAWISNGSDIAEAKVTVNGTEYITNQTGWITFDTTFDKVGKLTWNVTDIKYKNLNLFANPTSLPLIIWDRIKIKEQKTFEQVIQTGSKQTIWLTAEYEYDSRPFDDSKGTIFLNYKPMTWSNENKRWEQTVISNQTGLEQFEATSVNDNQGFELTTINQAEKINLTWDQIEVTNTKIETTQFGKTAIKFDVNFEYTKNSIPNSEVIINGVTCEQINQKTYTCSLNTWSPIQVAQISIESMNFNQYTKNLSIVHITNTVLYIAIVSAIILPILFLIKRRKNKTQKTKSKFLT